jgi:hypothetical protein
MARAYQPKKTSTKLIEGLTAGLIGGVIFIIVTMIADAITRGGDLLYTVARIGAILAGPVNAAQGGSTPFGAQFLVGALLLLALFALLGIGFVSYLPIVFRLGLNKALFGAIYGVFIWLAVFFVLLGFINRDPANSLNIWVLLVSSVLGGAGIGLALDYVMSRKGGSDYGQSEQAGNR